MWERSRGELRAGGDMSDDHVCVKRNSRSRNHGVYQDKCRNNLLRDQLRFFFFLKRVDIIRRERAGFVTTMTNVSREKKKGKKFWVSHGVVDESTCSGRQTTRRFARSVRRARNCFDSWFDYGVASRNFANKA